MPSVTVNAPVEALVAEGHTPIFVDGDAKSWLTSPKATKNAVTKRVAAVITVDWLGTQCDLVLFREMAKEHGIMLVPGSKRGSRQQPVWLTLPFPAWVTLKSSRRWILVAHPLSFISGI